MRVALGTVDVDDDYRRQIAHYAGRHRKLATREEVRRHLLNVGDSLNDDMSDEYLRCDQCHEEPTE